MTMTKAQVADRVNYIGGTDAAAVLGASRYKTPLGLWTEKTGAVIHKNRDGELPIILGNLLEDVVAELFTIKTGIKLQRVKEVQVHPDHPFIRAQIDRFTVGLPEREVVECKTASAFKAGEWEGDDVPSEYIVQGLHQLMVLGAIAKKKGLPPPPRVHLACLIGGNVDFVYKAIERDEEMIAELEAKEVAFWHEHIVKKVMPKVTEHDAGTLAALFPNAKENEEPVTLPESFDAILARIKEIGTDKTGAMGKLKAEKDELQNEIRAFLGETSNAICGNWKVTWKAQTRTSLDTERLSAEMPEVYAKFLETSTIRILRTSDTTAKKGAK